MWKGTSRYAIGVGVHSIKKPDSWTKYLKVANLVIHSEYERKTIQNDIALIKLEKPVEFDTKNFRVIPVCVPTESESFQDKTSYATGWGTL